MRERVAAVLPFEDRFLLEELRNPQWPDNLGKRRLPGGGIQPHESPEEAIIRELFEEFGVVVTHQQLRGCEMRFGAEETLYIFEIENHGLLPGVYQCSSDSGDSVAHLV